MTMAQPLNLQRLPRSLHEILILGTLRARPLHGYLIAQEIELTTGGYLRIRHGTLYPILQQLEKNSLVRGSWVGDGGDRTRR
jgi:DNA-binding PadR family transcriptional regulator